MIQSDIDFWRKEYVRQKALEQIVSKRQLARPNTTKWQVIILLSIVPFLVMGAILFSIFLPIFTVYKIVIVLVLLLLISELYLRFCFIQTVKCYQHYAKEETRRRCLCVPSCSEYALIALKKIFPLTVALFKIRKRLYHTCKGEEYILDFPFQRMNVEFEKTYLSR